MKVAIISFGIEGQAAYQYWKAKGADITIHDKNPEAKLPEGTKSVLGPDYLKQLDGYDLVVRGASVKPWEIQTKAPVTSVIKEFMAQCPARVIGVTGTKGKGTTCTLIARILGEAAWRTWVGGNIGQVPLEFLPKIRANHLVVLELSSFQLMDLDLSPHIAVCLMIAPEHMDWHRNMREYVAAKGNIFWHQQPEDLAVYDAKNDFSTQVAQLSPGERVPYLAAPGARVEKDRIVIEDTDICGTDEVGLIGAHNLENICAAITATWDLVERDPEPVRRAVKAFTGLEHHIELVREVAGVSYYDDSFSTVPDSAMAAIASFDQPKVIILGGSDKLATYEALAKAVKGGNVRQAILIGDTAPKIKAALDAVGFTNVIMGPRTMPDIVSSARAVAQKGDVVLLSPACASFGLFENYKDRGEKFKAAVRALK
jgi:UDP-N-acetylmuramoylalanine--D-glutamate ligase